VTAVLWPLAVAIVGCAFAYGLWDVGKRIAAAKANSNDALEKRYRELLLEHQETYKKALAELGKQMREEIDSMDGEVDRCVGWVRSKHGEKPDEHDKHKPLPWQQSILDQRAQMRKQHARRSMQ